MVQTQNKIRNQKSRLGSNIIIFHLTRTKDSFCVEILPSRLAQINLRPQSLLEFAAVLIQSMVWCGFWMKFRNIGTVAARVHMQ